MSKSFIHCLAAILLLVVAACGTTRKATEITPRATDMATAKNIVAQHNRWKQMAAKLQFTLRVDDRKPTSLAGSLRMKRGELVSISLQPFLGIEVARIEFSPDGLLILDRMHKQYTQLPYAELSKLIHAKVPYSTLESLFFNEIFIPDQDKNTAIPLQAFALSSQPDEVQLKLKRSDTFDYTFVGDKRKGVLKETNIHAHHSNYGIRWTYEQFIPVGLASFPQQMQITLLGSDKPTRVDLALSRLDADEEKRISPTSVPAGYQSISLDELIKLITKK